VALHIWSASRFSCSLVKGGRSAWSENPVKKMVIAKIKVTIKAPVKEVSNYISET